MNPTQKNQLFPMETLVAPETACSGLRCSERRFKIYKKCYWVDLEVLVWFGFVPSFYFVVTSSKTEIYRQQFSFVDFVSKEFSSALGQNSAEVILPSSAPLLPQPSCVVRCSHLSRWSRVGAGAGGGCSSCSCLFSCAIQWRKMSKYRNG